METTVSPDGVYWPAGEELLLPVQEPFFTVSQAPRSARGEGLRGARLLRGPDGPERVVEARRIGVPSKGFGGRLLDRLMNVASIELHTEADPTSFEAWRAALIASLAAAVAAAEEDRDWPQPDALRPQVEGARDWPSLWRAIRSVRAEGYLDVQT